MDETKQFVIDILSNYTGKAFDVCDFLYRSILSKPQDQHVDLFQSACELFGTIRPRENAEVVSSEIASQVDFLRDTNGELLDKLIVFNSNKGLEEKEFYRTLWDIINNPQLFANEEDRSFAFFWIVIDSRIPYFRIDPSLMYSMENEQFREIQRKYTVEKQRIRFILKTEIKQKTQRASVLLNELGINIPQNAGSEEYENYEKCLVQMVAIVQELERDKEKLLSVIKELRNEDA